MYEVLIILHILGAGIILGVVFFSLVFVFKQPVSLSKLKAVMFIRAFGPYAVGWEIVTGMILALQKPEVSASPFFWYKLMLIVLDGILAHLLINKKIDLALQTPSTESVTLKGMPSWALVSVIIIITIIIFGVLI